MCAKQLYVKSNGAWVAAGGAGGSADTAGLATEQFVTDAIGAGGFATLNDLNDALATIPESAITLHAGAVPDAGADTPQGLEDAFAVLDDGLHYYKDVGTLVSIARQEYQTTIVLSGQLSSFAKIVKSEGGLPTPQNPSMIVMQRAEGQWLKLTSDALDEPFGKPQQVDIFAADVDLSGYYTKPEVDAKLEADKDFSIANDNVLLASITSLQEIVSNLGELGTAQIDVLDAIRDVEIEPSMITLSGDSASPIAWKGGLSLVPVKEGTDWKLGWNNGKSVSNLATQEDLSGYAQKADPTQNVVVNAVVAKGYTFGDAISTSNPGLVYIDTNEGYGPRLVLDTPGGKELIPYQSDFEPIKERLDALESKAAPTVDLSPYITQVDADARYGARTAEAVSLLQGQLQSIFDSIYTRPEADDRYAERAKTYTKTECDGKFLTLVDIDRFAYQADVYTQKQTDDRFMRIEQAFSKADFDNQMALMLYSRKQIDDRLAAINPLGSPSINNPALAEFKQSVLDEVKLMLVGGTKMPPPDIDWTPIIRMDGAKETTSTEIQARMLGGFIELKGTLSFTAGTTEWIPLRMPPQFPLAELEANYPLAMRLVGSAVTYGFCTVSNKTRDIKVSPGARSSEAGFSGIRWKAAY